MKKIMLLGGSAQQVIAIDTAKRMGLFTILCDYLPDNPGQFHADKFYQVSTTDIDAVLAISRAEKIDYIIAYASDPAAPTAAYVAEQMGLPTNPYESVRILCNKDLFRGFLKEHGFSTPSAMGFSDMESALGRRNELSFPVIIKPVDSSGSKGVTVLRDANGFEEAVEFAFSFSRSKRIIIEEYIEKRHPYLIGGDIFVSGGKVVQWGLMNCHRDSSVNPLVPVGKSYPPLVDERDLISVKNTLQRLVDELGIQFGAMNVEVIVDAKGRVFLVDIGPRSGGNMIPDLLGMIFQCDLVEMSLRAAMGEIIDVSTVEGNPYFATMNIHSASDGILERIDFSDWIDPFIVRKNIYKKKGDEIKRFTNAAYALGIVFLHYPDMEKMLECEEKMNDCVRVVLQED
jgi:biotin carboxylase